MKTIHVRIEGRVQGVFFRAYTEQQARSLGLTGWVRNMADGAVEAIFCGDEKDITSMIDLLHTGSPHSNVSQVIVSDSDPQQEFSSFKIIA